HRLDLGEDLMGPLVALEREPARSLPCAVPLLLRVLHAALLRRGRAGAGEPLRRLRALRRRPDPGQLPGDPPGPALHPPGRLYEPWPARARDDAARVPRLMGGDADPVRDALPRGASRKAARLAPPRAPGAAGVTTAEKYVAAAYLVVFLAVLAFVFIIALKLVRLEREVAELTELAR